MRYLTYVGTSTDERLEGIHVLETDAATGAFRRIGLLEGVADPIYFTLNRERTLLYTAQRATPSTTGGMAGAVAVYALRDSHLECIDCRPAAPTVPCHVALAPGERALVFAEYANAVAGVFALRADGRFEDTPPVTVRHHGRGPHPTRQESAHAHCAEVTPDGRLLCICDLGLDRVAVYDFTEWRSGLRPLPGRDIVTAGGAGPRHIVFHPGGRFAFLLNELDNTVVSLAYDGHAFATVQTLSTLPAGFSGASKAAAVKVSADGRFLFASNRGHDSIATFAVDAATGRLERTAISPLTGRFPRDFEFAPGGRIALVGHKLSNEVAAYAFDAATGRLSPLPGVCEAHRPLCIKFGRPL